MPAVHKFKKIPLGLLFAAFAVFCLLSILGAIYADVVYLYALPLLAILLLTTVAQLRFVYYLLWLFIPLSFELEVGGGLAINLPDEPLMLLLTGAIGFYLMANPRKINLKFPFHPIIGLLLLHLIWMSFCVVNSQFPLVSIKFFLAKIWFVVPFVFGTALFVKNHHHFKPIFWCIMLPLSFVIVRAIILHADYDFEFAMVNKTMVPFFRNHVNYSVMLAVFFPIVLFARNWYAKGSLERLVIHTCLLLLFMGILLGTSRAAYGSLVLIPIIHFVIKRKLAKPIAVLGTILLIVGIIYMRVDNRYLELAPDFDNTIFHENFDEHLAATFAGEDLSSMERVYRWVAAAHMSGEHPFVGFGPGNFYNYYQSYTLNSFTTYVSDNPEMSGVHNYFLMTLVEQGIPGLLIFYCFCLFIFVYGENVHHTVKDPQNKAFALSILCCVLLAIANNTLSDLMEVDKIGSLFFTGIAILVNLRLFEGAENRHNVGLSK